MQAVKLRHLGFRRWLIVIVAIGILAGAILVVAMSSEAFSSTERDQQVIERSVPVDQRDDRPATAVPDTQQTPTRPRMNWPRDRP